MFFAINPSGYLLGKDSHTPLMKRACSSVDTVARQVITTPLLATGAPGSVNYLLERERERESLTYLTNTSNVDSLSLIFYIYRKIPEPGPDRFYRLFPLVDYPFCYPFSASRLLFPQQYNVVIENKIFSEKISFFSVSLLFVLRTELPSAMFPPAWSAGVFCIYGSVLFPSAPDDLPCIRAPPLNAPYPPGRRRKPPRRCLCGYA